MKNNPPAARGDDFAPAYNKVRAIPARTKMPQQLVKRVISRPALSAPKSRVVKPSTPAKAIAASNYIRQYGDKGYVPSNGVGVGGSPTGEQKLQKIKKIDPGSLMALPLKKKKQYKPSNAGYSNFA